MNSFILNKNHMSVEEIRYFQAMRNHIGLCDTVGETENFFFGVLDYNREFYTWIKNIPYVKFEWSLV